MSESDRPDFKITKSAKEPIATGGMAVQSRFKRCGFISYYLAAYGITFRKNSGLDVPSSAISKAIEYLERSYKSKLNDQGEPIDKKSGFAYQPGGHPEYTTTAAGLLAMQVCGQYESPFVLGAADWLLDHVPQTNRKFFFYGTYYYAQAMYQRGDEHAEKARKLVEEILLPMQKENGAWQGGGSESGAGEVYCSSMAMLALAVKYHYLPIYQR